jgi:ligand-binding sensor domain-containing protein
MVSETHYGARLLIIVAARLSLLILLWFHGTAAQYRFDHWTTDNGLPQNSIRSITQTRDGYLWMTTFDGLARFNGVQFKVFDKSNTKGLSSNRFTALHEDEDGTLWMGTIDGGLTRYRDGAFTSYTTADGVPPGPVLAFSHDLKGELLINIGSGQFYMRDGKFTSAPPEYLDQDMRLYLGPSGTQWTIEKNETRQVKDGHTTRYRLDLTLDGLWLYEDSQTSG